MKLDRDTILEALAENRQKLVDLGVASIGLFGSAVRNEASAASDIDLLVRLRIHSFDAYMDVKEFLEQLFKRRVDLILESAVKPALRHRIEEETVHATGF